MPFIRVREHESFEAAVRRFNRLVEKSGVLSEVRRRAAFESKSAERKRSLDAAVKRLKKKQHRDGVATGPGNRRLRQDLSRRSRPRVAPEPRRGRGGSRG